MRKTFARGVALMLCVLLVSQLPACTRFVAKDTTEVEVQEKVRVTFANGSQVQGRLDLDEWVDVTVDGVIHRGRIIDRNADELFVGDAVPVLRIGENRYEVRRMVDGRIQATGETKSYIFQLNEIEKVELVKIDGPKTARRIGFWSWLGLSALLLFIEEG